MTGNTVVITWNALIGTYMLYHGMHFWSLLFSCYTTEHTSRAILVISRNTYMLYQGIYTDGVYNVSLVHKSQYDKYIGWGNSFLCYGQLPDFTWRMRCWIHLNPFPHVIHLNGRSSLCLLLCALRFRGSVFLYGHLSQAYSFLPCDTRCALRSDSRLNLFPHLGLKHTQFPCTWCTLLCSRSWLVNWNPRPQISHSHIKS